MLERLFAYIEREWAVLKTAPFAFVMLAVLCSALGFGGGMMYYTAQVGSLHEQIIAKEGQISRYRVALGVDPASRGALVELSNDELAAKAQSTVKKLRELSNELDVKLGDIKKQADSGKISAKEASASSQAAMQQVSQDFDSNLASDANNLYDELHKRLDASAIAHVVRMPAFKTDGVSVPLIALIKNSGFDSFMIRGYADEIEQMAKLLPPDSQKKQ